MIHTAHNQGKSTAYKYMLILVLIGLIFSLLNIALWGTHRQVSAWLAPYLAGLWALWIAYTLLRNPNTSLWTVFALWSLIDIMMLLFLVGNSIGMHDWYHETDLELLLYYIVYPLVQPTGSIALHSEHINNLLFGYLPSFGETLIKHGVAAPIAAWFVETLAIFPQTALVMLFGQMSVAIRRRRNRARDER